MNFKEEYQRRQEEIETIIQTYLPRKQGNQAFIVEVMEYSLLAGGKRIRPMMMRETYRLFGGNGTLVEPFMAAMEMIHTYSLVHDDLPAMDNDEYRRGKKSTHAEYGEAIAILAGDGLLNYAFETACTSFENKIKIEEVAKSLMILSKKAGIYGMIGGQAADIKGEMLSEEEITKEYLLYIHEFKTAALIQASLMIGATLAGAKENEVNEMEQVGYYLGVAFQIQDDILDITSTFDILGKPINSDEKNGKITYVTMNGLEKSKKDVISMTENALDIMKHFKVQNEFLNELIVALITREK